MSASTCNNTTAACNIFTGDTFRPAWINSLSQVADIHALYIHIPFCARRCLYCDFETRAISRFDPSIASYMKQIEHQLRIIAETGLLDSIQTVYIGGGTPSFIALEHLEHLLKLIRQLCAPQELSVEANPDSLGCEAPFALRDAGATRISVGVQSLIPAELVALGRIHTREQALASLESCVLAGLITSCDLMCAIPLQTPKSFEQSLSEVVTIHPHHVSVYPLQLEEGTPLEQLVASGKQTLPDEDAASAYMLQAERLLQAAGMHRYEVASYALGGYVCAHNIAYWTGVPYLGIGHGAASMLTPSHYESLRKIYKSLPALNRDAVRVRMSTTISGASQLSIAEHTKAAHSSPCFDLEFLTLREALAEDLMLAARMNAAIDAELLHMANNVMGDAISHTLAELVRRGLLSNQLQPTQRGWLLGNELYGALWALSHD